jgi:hypothetical protein
MPERPVVMYSGRRDHKRLAEIRAEDLAEDELRLGTGKPAQVSRCATFRNGRDPLTYSRRIAPAISWIAAVDLIAGWLIDGPHEAFVVWAVIRRCASRRVD